MGIFTHTIALIDSNDLNFHPFAVVMGSPLQFYFNDYLGESGLEMGTTLCSPAVYSYSGWGAIAEAKSISTNLFGVILLRFSGRKRQ